MTDNFRARLVPCVLAFALFTGWASTAHAQGYLSPLIGFNFGGNFALFPTVTADFFGNRNLGSNYGWVFSAYGVAGIAAPLLAGYFKDAAEGAAQPIAWMTPFLIAGIACLVGASIMLFMSRPGCSPGSAALVAGKAPAGMASVPQGR